MSSTAKTGKATRLYMSDNGVTPVLADLLTHIKSIDGISETTSTLDVSDLDTGDVNEKIENITDIGDITITCNMQASDTTTYDAIKAVRDLAIGEAGRLKDFGIANDQLGGIGRSFSAFVTALSIPSVNRENNVEFTFVLTPITKFSDFVEPTV